MKSLSFAGSLSLFLNYIYIVNNMLWGGYCKHWYHVPYISQAINLYLHVCWDQHTLLLWCNSFAFCFDWLMNKNHILYKLKVNLNEPVVWLIYLCSLWWMATGQVGAIRLGISRALQNWEPDLRPALRSGTLVMHNIFLSFISLFDSINSDWSLFTPFLWQ